MALPSQCSFLVASDSAPFADTDSRFGIQNCWASPDELMPFWDHLAADVVSRPVRVRRILRR